MSENDSSQTKTKDVRILLIHPPLTLPIVEAPSLEPPLGLAYLAAYVEKAGYEVRILDAVASGVMNIKREGDYVRVGLDDSDIEDYVRDFAPQIVGISAAFTETGSDSHHVAGLVKEVNPEILVVADKGTFLGLLDGSLSPWKAWATKQLKVKASLPDMLLIKKLITSNK